MDNHTRGAFIEKARKAMPKMKVPVLRLTPAMRDAAVGKGFSLFARGLPFTLTPVDHDPFDDPMARYYDDADRISKELRK
jgi:hypothetical protein